MRAIGWVCSLGCVVFAAAASDAFAARAPTEGPGGGEYVFEDPGPHLTEAQRQEIWRAIERNVTLLKAEGKLPLVPRVAEHPLLAWPLRAANGLDDFGFHGISGFVDQNPAFPNALLDYNCGTRTYDTAAGYNHKGVDIFTWPFPWNKMDNDEVEVVAAAPGTIVLREDGAFDRSCAANNNFWNAVYVQHADGSYAWYGHMKNGSLTPKGVGQTVVAGERLGVVGSSGNSTGPHLHLEVYDSLGSLNEPYYGPCNAMNTTSWWQSQRPYYDSAVNAMSTGIAAVDHGTCPNQGSPNAQSLFHRGQYIYFTTFYRDQLSTQMSTYRVRGPDDVVYWEWTHNSPAPYYAASWWYWSFYDPAWAGPNGVWSFEVTFNGKTYSIPFVIEAAPGGRVSRLTVDKVGGAEIRLDWNPSCIVSDTNYSVYEGELGNWYDHRPVTCSTSGAVSHALTPSYDAAYYLVVPTNGVFDGSHGVDSASAERPPGIAPCRVQDIAACPP